MSNENFRSTISEGYQYKGESLIMGGAMMDDSTIPELFVRAPLSMFNRHEMISGATGTGKTKSL